MSELPSAALRALAGLLDGTGETLVVAGPAFSGKSEVLAEVRARLEARGCHVVTVTGSYREREVPFAALASLEEDPPRGPWFAEGDPAERESSVPPSALPYVPEAPVEPRRRGAGPKRGVVLGHTYVTPARSAAKRDPTEYWTGLAQGFATSKRSVAILVEDACFLDAQSREFLLALTERARLRPLLLALALDLQVPSYAEWEERLVGRSDVDWIRFSHPKPNPRDIRHFRETYDLLPEPTRRALGYVALMGGSIPEVYLARVMHRPSRGGMETLAHAVDRGVVKVDAGRVSITHDAWVAILPRLIPDAERAEMHHDIAETLAALASEPRLERRLEVAHHFYQWHRGPVALRYLVETAELSERLNSFDSAAELVAQALSCVRSLPAGERAPTEAELRLFYARMLIFSGRPADAEQEMREGVAAALRGAVPPARLEEWLEGLVPALRAAGPRPALLSELVDLAERCHEAGAIGAEVLLQSTLAELEVERNRLEKAQEEAHRAMRLARSLGRGPTQATALLAVGLTRIEGSPAEQAIAEKFLTSARKIFSDSRRLGLEQTAEEYLIRGQEARGERSAALRARERAVPTAQRLRALVTELEHQLGIASVLVDEPLDARLAAALGRAREISGLLHLRPPSSALLRLWLLEGRLDAVSKSPEMARERWRAIVDLAPVQVPPRIRAEALVRLAMLEVADGQEGRAAPYLDRLETAALSSSLPPEWADRVPKLRQRARSASPN